MRLIDADEAKKQIKQMQTLKPSERMMFRLALDRTPTYEPPNPPLTLEELREMDGEPVWWWNTSCKPFCTICHVNRFSKNPAFVNFDFVYEDCTDITNFEYFKSHGYKAYRRKPREGTP